MIVIIVITEMNDRLIIEIMVIIREGYDGGGGDSADGDGSDDEDDNIDDDSNDSGDVVESRHLNLKFPATNAASSTQALRGFGISDDVRVVGS